MRFLSALLSKPAGLPMRCVLPQAKNLFPPLDLTALSCLADAGIQKPIHQNERLKYYHKSWY